MTELEQALRGFQILQLGLVRPREPPNAAINLFLQELRPPLPTIVGTVDYLTLRQRLEQNDALLRARGVARDFVQRALEAWAAAASRDATALRQSKFQQRWRRALRCTLLRTLLQEDYRGFSCQLAGKPFERKLGEGMFGLQGHDPGSTIRYKNIRVKRLD